MAKIWKVNNLIKCYSSKNYYYNLFIYLFRCLLPILVGSVLRTVNLHSGVFCFENTERKLSMRVFPPFSAQTGFWQQLYSSTLQAVWFASARPSWKAMEDKAQIQEAIKVQGEVVRKLKSEKASKEQVSLYTLLSHHGWIGYSMRWSSELKGKEVLHQ